MLKKDSFKIERDALNENIYYLSFDYISMNKINLKIFFNCCENTSQNKINEDENNKDKKINKNSEQVQMLKDDLIIKEDTSCQEEENYLGSKIKKIHFKQ